MAAFAAASIMLLGMAAGWMIEASRIRLVGYGCDGTGGPIYAAEESDFPRCDKIERRKLFWKE